MATAKIMVTTKKQEREALEEIRKIVDKMGGTDSYIGMAFEGCFEIAEENIDNDFGCSMKQRVEIAQKRTDRYEELANKTASDLADALKQIERLQRELETEQEWRDYELDGNVPQEDYEHLAKQSDTRFLTDEEAKDLLYDWFGFAKEKITIHRSVPIYQVNRHRQLRKTGEYERRPAYNATDWNYIRFDCAAGAYELYNDQIRLFCQ